MPIFLSVEQVLKIHVRMIEELGGMSGVRDKSLLESALGVPESSYYFNQSNEDIASLAGAYLFHLCRNHPFVDGNKRVAAAVTDVFLRVNGHKLEIEPMAFAELVLEVATNSITKEQLIETLKQRVISLEE